MFPSSISSSVSIDPNMQQNGDKWWHDCFFLSCGWIMYECFMLDEVQLMLQWFCTEWTNECEDSGGKQVPEVWSASMVPRLNSLPLWERRGYKDTKYQKSFSHGWRRYRCCCFCYRYHPGSVARNGWCVMVDACESWQECFFFWIVRGGRVPPRPTWRAGDLINHHPPIIVILLSLHCSGLLWAAVVLVLLYTHPRIHGWCEPT